MSPKSTPLPSVYRLQIGKCPTIVSRYCRCPGIHNIRDIDLKENLAVLDIDPDALSSGVRAVEDVDYERHTICRHAADQALVLYTVRDALAKFVDGLDVGIDK